MMAFMPTWSTASFSIHYSDEIGPPQNAISFPLTIVTTPFSLSPAMIMLRDKKLRRKIKEYTDVLSRSSTGKSQI
jgi:hypothetical protein